MLQCLSFLPQKTRDLSESVISSSPELEAGFPCPPLGSHYFCLSLFSYSPQGPLCHPLGAE